MNDLKQHMYQRLRSAQKWLTKAEQSFDKQHDIRAELDLMLAQAELQHVKETERSWQWRCKYAVLRHGVALTMAMFLVVVAGGLYWWNYKPEPAVPVPLAGQVVVSAERQGKTLPTSTKVTTQQETSQLKQNDGTKQQEELQVANEKEQSKQVEPVKKSEPLKRVEQANKVEEQRSAEPTAVLSPDEMQKLVRAAGKSLRGQ